MNIYVGNLPYKIDEDQLKALFEQFGEVVSTRIVKDKFTGNAKGFAFVEMADKDEAQRAIDELNGSEFEGRNIRVNEARPREERPARPPRSNGGGGRGRF